MSRAPFQVLVFPFLIQSNGSVRYALFKRNPSSGGYWQGVAGGGEDNEVPLDAAKRETLEEAGIDPDHRFMRLDSCSTIPVVGICGFEWGGDVLVIPQYCFGVEASSEQIILSFEHTEFSWVEYEEAQRLLHWESNKNALWELNFRLDRSKSRHPVVAADRSLPKTRG